MGLGEVSSCTGLKVNDKKMRILVNLRCGMIA